MAPEALTAAFILLIVTVAPHMATLLVITTFRTPLLVDTMVAGPQAFDRREANNST